MALTEKLGQPIHLDFDSWGDLCTTEHRFHEFWSFTPRRLLENKKKVGFLGARPVCPTVHLCGFPVGYIGRLTRWLMSPVAPRPKVSLLKFLPLPR